MLGEMFNAACNYASAAVIATNMAVTEPQANVDLADLGPRAEIAGMALQEPGTIPGVHTCGPETQANNFTVDTQVAGLLNPPAHSDMQVHYTNEATATFDQNFQPGAPGAFA